MPATGAPMAAPKPIGSLIRGAWLCPAATTPPPAGARRGSPPTPTPMGVCSPRGGAGIVADAVREGGGGAEGTVGRMEGMEGPWGGPGGPVHNTCMDTHACFW
eukprot:scaffold45565_cov20-Tisochrysis_lutea.AAC.1